MEEKLNLAAAERYRQAFGRDAAMPAPAEASVSPETRYLMSILGHQQANRQGLARVFALFPGLGLWYLGSWAPALAYFVLYFAGTWLYLSSGEWLWAAGSGAVWLTSLIHTLIAAEDN